MVVVCGGGVASAMVGAFLITRGIASAPANEHYLTSTVQLAPQGSTCQRLVIDNSTGAIKSTQQISCGPVSKESPTPSLTANDNAPARYSSGGRLDTVRESFRNR